MAGKTVIALERRLKGCKNVITLGVRPNFEDYPTADAERIRQADAIYYPTSYYADLLEVAGKRTFPGFHTYRCAQDKIKQSALFLFLGIPHPRTRVFYGKRSRESIVDHFDFPFIAKVPRGSSMGRGVYLVRNREELAVYVQQNRIAYIQEYLPLDRDIRVVVIGRKVAHAYWRINSPHEFRSNVSLGARVSLDPVPPEALNLALYTASCCRWDDVGIDICRHNRGFYVLEANMKYGKEGFRAAGIDYFQLMEKLIENGEI